MIKSYISILRTNMSSLEFKLKKIDETRNYFLEEKNKRINIISSNMKHSSRNSVSPKY